MLIDAMVRQTMVLIAQLATAGGARAQLSHTANQVFLDLVGALKEQGLGNKVIADMFGMALRTYQTKLQRLSESRTDRGRSLWEALYGFVQDKGKERAVPRAVILQRFRHDDALVVSGVLRDLVDSGLLYRTGRGDLAQYGVAQAALDDVGVTADERAQHLVWVCVHRLAPVGAEQIAEQLSMDVTRVRTALGALLGDGRVRHRDEQNELYESEGCVLPLGSSVGWEAALFDHYQAMVTAICAKLDSGRRSSAAGDLIGGSTFGFSVWPSHPYYEEATRFLGDFRANGSALRKKIAAYNEGHAPPETGSARVVIYAGQTVLGLDETEED